ncbi:PepSY domain-containing protein [Domibacillus indicus]|uniref:PepSY domain-containing protein n=1 Tax=Domibacillus indicus TaxID=1437523 RepID=UPI00069883B8|nr:PepSY domain-containing protein [Domibacillus indicus]
MKKTIIAGSLLTAGLLGGGVFWGMQNDKIQAEVPGFNTKLTIEEASSIAEKETNSAVESVELERDLTGPVYEVDTQGYDVKIDGNSGDVLKTEQDDDDTDDDFNGQHEQASAAVTQEEAIAAAEKQVKGTVKDIELDDGGYEIEIHDGNKETDVYVDGTTGKVQVGETDLND